MHIYKRVTCLYLPLPRNIHIHKNMHSVDIYGYISIYMRTCIYCNAHTCLSPHHRLLTRTPV